MTIKTLLTAAALVAAPVLAHACPAHQEAKMTCAEGSVYDADSGTCKVVSG